MCYLVWNILPGVRLGDKCDRRPSFWTLDLSVMISGQHLDIHTSMCREYCIITWLNTDCLIENREHHGIGIIPLLLGLTHLVLESRTQRGYVACTGLWHSLMLQQQIGHRIQQYYSIWKFNQTSALYYALQSVRSRISDTNLSKSECGYTAGVELTRPTV